MSQQRVLVTGAGGFIGHHLVAALKRAGYWVRGVDLKRPAYTPSEADEFLLLDLRRWEQCLSAAAGMELVYNLASDMGGMGFISQHHAQILHNNLLISTHCAFSQYLRPSRCMGRWTRKSSGGHLS